MDLQDLKLQNVNIGGGSNFICLLDNDGIATGSYGWWLPEDGTGEEAGCWFDGDSWEKIENVKVANGEGFYVYTEESGLTIMSAGSVRLSDYETALAAGYNLAGNASPVDLDLQKLSLKGALIGGGSNFICLLDNDGIATGSYGWWLPEDGTGEEAGCWFDGDNWEKIEEVTIKAGEGLYIYAEEAGLSLCFPKAL